MKNLKITVFADPVCTWCWGSVPVIRALEYRLGDKVEIEYVMGCMIDDIAKYSNRRLGIGGDIELSNRNLFKAWTDASAVHGMPVGEKENPIFDKNHRSTAPQNIAYIAATLYKKKTGSGNVPCPERFLHRLQEATAVDGLRTCDSSVIVDIAAAVGFEPHRFKEIMDSREAQRLFEQGKSTAAHYEVHSFPTYLLQYKGTEMILRGYTSLDTVMQNIGQLTYGKISLEMSDEFSATAENVKHFIERYGSVYPVEIATAFGMQRISGKSALNIESYEGLPAIVEELVASYAVSLKPRGNGFMLYWRKPQLQYGTPVCSINGCEIV